MIHPGEKPFNCSKFKTISSLKRHERATSRANSVTGASQHDYFTDMFWYLYREIYEIPYKFEVFLYREIYEIQYKFKKFLESKNNTGTFKKISHKSHWYLFSGSMFIRYWRVGCFKDSLKAPTRERSHSSAPNVYLNELSRAKNGVFSLYNMFMQGT